MFNWLKRLFRRNPTPRPFRAGDRVKIRNTADITLSPIDSWPIIGSRYECAGTIIRMTDNLNEIEWDNGTSVGLTGTHLLIHIDEPFIDHFGPPPFRIGQRIAYKDFPSKCIGHVLSTEKKPKYTGSRGLETVQYLYVVTYRKNKDNKELMNWANDYVVFQENYLPDELFEV